MIQDSKICRRLNKFSKSELFLLDSGRDAGEDRGSETGLPQHISTRLYPLLRHRGPAQHQPHVPVQPRMVHTSLHSGK